MIKFCWHLFLYWLICSVIAAIVSPSAKGQDVWQGAATDQQRCEAEARYMVARNIRGHVGPVIGRFEGVGFGGRNCSTCVPRGRMVLTGDAVAQYSDGTWCRVRSWR